MSSTVPPPLARTTSVGWRSLGAGAAGAIAYTVTLFRFLSYQERNRMGAQGYMYFGIAALAIGFVAAVGVGKKRSRIAGGVMLGAFAMHAAVIAMDLEKDPTDHNLLPFEFVILGVCAAPAYAGAALSRLISR